MNTVLFSVVIGIYGAATLLYVVYFARPAETLGKAAGRILASGFAFHCLFTVNRYLESGYTPITNPHESLSFFSLAVVGVFLAFQW